MIKTLEEFTFSGSFSIQLKNYGFFEPKVIYIDVCLNSTLTELQKELTLHVKKNLHIFNEAASDRAFKPHVTIAFRDLKKTDFYSAKMHFENKVFEGSLICEGFCLLKYNGKSWDVFRKFNF